jgi:hypothetical protein
MHKIQLDIIEKGQECELQKEHGLPVMKGDCEKILYMALAESRTQPTEIIIRDHRGPVKRRIFVPETLHKEELNKRKELLKVIGNFFRVIVHVPEEISGKFSDTGTNDLDSLYDHLLLLLEHAGWGQFPYQQQIKTERGDEIQKMDNLVYLAGDLLQYYRLVSSFIYSDFLSYGDTLTVEELKDNLQWMIERNHVQENSRAIHEPASPEGINDEFVPVQVEYKGEKKILAWISKDALFDIVPVFDKAGNIIGWFIANKY